MIAFGASAGAEIAPSLSEQRLAQMGGRSSVLARQRRDHIRLDRLLQRLAQLPATEQEPVLLRIRRLVFPHAFAEESVLWPVIRRILPDGEQLTLKVELEHQAINELTARLQRLDPRAPERQRVLDSIVALLRQDVRDEEDQLLPRLQARLTRPQLRRLGLAWEVVRRIAPTRPHPVVSRRPPGNVLSALPLTVLDRSRDRIEAALQRRSGRGGGPLVVIASLLAQTSDLVEQLPGLQSGEDMSTRVGRKPRAVAVFRVVFASAAACGVVMLAHRRRKEGGMRG